MAKLLGEGVYVCNDWFDATHIKIESVWCWNSRKWNSQKCNSRKCNSRKWYLRKWNSRKCNEIRENEITKIKFAKMKFQKIEFRENEFREGLCLGHKYECKAKTWKVLSQTWIWMQGKTLKGFVTGINMNVRQNPERFCLKQKYDFKGKHWKILSQAWKSFIGKSFFEFNEKLIRFLKNWKYGKYFKLDMLSFAVYHLKLL